jgi:hypothetical protein
VFLLWNVASAAPSRAATSAPSWPHPRDGAGWGCWCSSWCCWISAPSYAAVGIVVVAAAAGGRPGRSLPTTDGGWCGSGGWKGASIALQKPMVGNTAPGTAASCKHANGKAAYSDTYIQTVE